MNEENIPPPADESRNHPSGTSSLNDTAARVTDIALGIGATAVESLDRVARSLDHAVRNVVGNAPELLDEFEEKGKPVRERLASLIANTPLAPPARHQPSPNPSRATDDIAQLEARVRELEAQQTNLSTQEPSNCNPDDPLATSHDATQEPQFPVDNLVESTNSHTTGDTPSTDPDRIA